MEQTVTDTPQRFRNTTGGHLGVIKVNRRGEEVSTVVEPGGEVLLTAEEQELTANAPSDPKKNPFLDQPYEDFDDEGTSIDKGYRPQLAVIDEKRPIPADAAAGEQPPAPQGSRDPLEVTGA